MSSAVPITFASRRPRSSPILNVRRVRLRSAPACVLELLGSRHGARRLLKKAHLRRWLRRSSLQRTTKYVSLLTSSPPCIWTFLNSLHPLTFILSPLGRGPGEGLARVKPALGRRAYLQLALLLLLAVPVAAWAQDAEEIVRKADLVRAPGGSFIWNVTVTAYEPGKAPTVNGFEVYVKDTNRTFVKFISPARNLGRSLLYLDRDLWIYLPDAGKPVRIPLSQRLVGQVANGDIARTNYSGDYTASLTGSESVDGVACYVLDLKAKSKEVTYSAIRYWVAKETFHPMKAEFFAGTGTLLKTGIFGEYKEEGGRLRPARVTLVDAIRRDVRSTMDFSDLRIRELPDKYFNKNYMKSLD